MDFTPFKSRAPLPPKCPHCDCPVVAEKGKCLFCDADFTNDELQHFSVVRKRRLKYMVLVALMTPEDLERLRERRIQPLVLAEANEHEDAAQTVVHEDTGITFKTKVDADKAEKRRGIVKITSRIFNESKTCAYEVGFCVAEGIWKILPF